MFDEMLPVMGDVAGDHGGEGRLDLRINGLTPLGLACFDVDQEASGSAILERRHVLRHVHVEGS